MFKSNLFKASRGEIFEKAGIKYSAIEKPLSHENKTPSGLLP